METKNRSRDQKGILAASMALLLLSILASLFVYENSGRDEDMEFTGNMEQESAHTVTSQNQSGDADQSAVQMIANPASTNCLEKGGSPVIKERPSGEYGTCVFEDNYQCEEWAMFRGECPVGGLKITDYATDASVYCVISGGEYMAREDRTAVVEQGSCSFKNGTICDVWDFWKGKCGRG